MSAESTQKFQTFQLFDANEVKKIRLLIEETGKKDLALLSNGEPQRNTRNNFVYYLPSNSNAKWYPYTSKIAEAVKKANKAWGFEISHIEDLQALEYSRTNFFKWHLDGFCPEYPNRKISFSIALSDPDEYKGGALEFQWRKEKFVHPKLKKGEICLFPSFLLHRVDQIQSGNRLQLVSWVQGKEGWK